jgi:II/X family phage/plasmid replication protein
VLLKMYNKYEEMHVRGHRLTEAIPVEIRELLESYAMGKLRVELELKGKELHDRGLRFARDWSPAIAEGVLSERLGRLEVSDTMKLADDVAAELPVRLLWVYHAWRAGEDLRVRCKRRMFYRYRAQLLEFGVDIAHCRPREVVAETQYLLGAPLKSFLVGDGAPPPEWSRGTEWLVSA